MTAWYACQKSVEQCPHRYASGRVFHSSRHVSSLRSPMARATTCRVLRQRAIQIHALFAFFKTNDHSSSHSSSVASGSFASGLMSVSLKGGNTASFFLAILPPMSVKLQRFAQCLANYSALQRLAIFLPCVPLNIHEVLGFPGYTAHTLGRSISAFHWVHARYAPIFHFHSRDTKG